MTTVIVFLFGAAAEGLHLRILLTQIPALIMIYGPITIYLLNAEGVRGSFGLFRRYLTNKMADNDFARIRAIASLGLMMGGLATLVGMILTMGHLTSGTERIAESIAGALASCLLGALPSVLLVSAADSMTVDKALFKTVAAFSGFVVMSNLGIVFFALWIVH